MLATGDLYGDRMELARHLELLDREGTRTVELGATADLDLRVPTCPDWTIAALLRHVGGLLTWSAEIVRTRRLEFALPGSVGAAPPEADADVVAWLGVKHREALEVFSSVSPAEPVWGWAGEHRAGFWPRRMLFEVVVHLTDLEAALGIEGTVDPELAVEGIDEHLSNLPWTGAWDAGVRALSGQFDTIGLHSTDGPTWRMVLMPGGMFWDRSDDPTAATVEGTVGELYLHTQGRHTDVRITGDVDLHHRTLGSLSF